MMQLTEEQRKALAGLCRIEIKRWKASSESNPNMRYMVELMEIALAALTAKPVGTIRIEMDWNTHRNVATLDMREDLVVADMAAGDELYTAPPAAALRPIELPSAFTPAVTSFGPSPASSMRLDHMGGWLNKARVIAAIREAGYEVNATGPDEKQND